MPLVTSLSSIGIGWSMMQAYRTVWALPFVLVGTVTMMTPKRRKKVQRLDFDVESNEFVFTVLGEEESIKVHFDEVQEIPSLFVRRTKRLQLSTKDAILDAKKGEITEFNLSMFLPKAVECMCLHFGETSFEDFEKAMKDLGKDLEGSYKDNDHP